MSAILSFMLFVLKVFVAIVIITLVSAAIQLGLFLNDPEPTFNALAYYQ